MRAEDVIGDALTTALTASDTPPPPSTLLATVAEAIGAHRCELRLGAKALSWSARETAPGDDVATLRLGSDPDIIATVAPAAAMPAAGAWKPLLLLLTPPVLGVGKETEANARMTARIAEEARCLSIDDRVGRSPHVFDERRIGDLVAEHGLHALHGRRRRTLYDEPPDTASARGNHCLGNHFRTRVERAPCRNGQRISDWH